MRVNQTLRNTLMRIGRNHLLVYLSFFLLILSLQAEIFYPWKDVHIGALDSKAWSGIVFALPGENGFAFRVKLEKEGGFADGNDILYLVSEVGPHSPDGAYSRLKLDLSLPFKMADNTPILIKPPSRSDTFVLEWSRQDVKTVIGRIQAPEGIRVHLVHYMPWDFRGRYTALKDGQIKGQCLGSTTHHYLLWTDPKGEYVNTEGNELDLPFTIGKEKSIYFVAGVGDEEEMVREQIRSYQSRKSIDSLLREEERRYRKKRVIVEGLYGGNAEAITNNIFWMALYQTGHNRLYLPAGRNRILPTPERRSDHWTIFEWDSFFNALCASIESSKHTEEMIRAVLETQYPNGNIPHWRSRSDGTPDHSQPPIGSYVTLKVFQKFGNLELLRYAYPYLVKWHSFWKEKRANGRARRDGNGDGLLEWGTDTEYLPRVVLPWEENIEGKRRSRLESGEENLPNWDEAGFNQETGTLTMNCVDLNSLYALDAWCLAQIADFLDRRREYETYLSEYETIKELINKHLWNEKEGFYFDQHWDGRLSSKKAASNFFPLLAKIPDKNMSLRMIRHLLNPEEFWGDFVIPTISRDDPSFKDQEQWRGTVMPATNYLVYQGLKAYHFDAVAAELAKRSSELFLRTWENYQLCPENFDSLTGEAGGERYQSWGPLFALIGLEEYLDFTPWEGFRFGMISPEQKGRLSRIFIQGRHYEVEVSRSELRLLEEGKEIIKANGGAAFRRFLYSENEISFEVKTFEKREMKIQFLVEGKYQVLIDEEIVNVVRGRSCKIKIPEDEHSVLIQLLERLD